MPISENELPVYPDTLSFVRLEDDAHPDVFGFLCIAPSGLRFKVQATFKKGVVDIALAKDFTTRVVQTLLERRDERAVRETNWASAAAAIQRLIIDFNNKRGQKETLLLAPDGRPLQ